MNSCDVLVIGSGFAGMAASLFAAQNNLSVIQAGGTGGIDFSTGFLDLMAVHPVAEQQVWQDPFAAIAAVRTDLPRHPYSLVTDDDIRAALDAFTAFLGKHGFCYTGYGDRNALALTPAGTAKASYLIPCSAWNGVLAMQDKAPTLLVDFHGLKSFSARQLAEVRRNTWPDLRAVRLTFPGLHGELYPEHMAWALADPQHRQTLAETVRPHLGSAKYVGFPAVLGMTSVAANMADLERHLGLPVFEIPTLPPSLAGPRLRAACDTGFPALGIRTLTQKLVRDAQIDSDGFTVVAGAHSTGMTIKARHVILATGRFFGKGLRADRNHIREAVFDLPVTQPRSREQWHQKQFFDPRGHAVNQAGLETDSRLRPLGSDGTVFHPHLYAAGAILAHQDWMRMKCGAGLAISTAWKAVQEIAKER